MTIEWSYLTEVLKLFNFGPHLINWVRAFYCDVSSCVMNNGFASPFVQLSRGVRQGCPLSGLLFVLAIELLGNAIRKAKDIKGIIYADNTTVFVADIFSAQKLKDLLLLFSKYSGLTLNPSKSEALWLGSLRNSEEQVLDFRKSEATVYELGVHFSYKSLQIGSCKREKLLPKTRLY